MYRRAPIHHSHQARVVERRVLLPLMFEASALLSRDFIEPELMLNFFHRLSQGNPLIYALLLQQNPNCYYDLSGLEFLRYEQMLTLLRAVDNALASYAGIRSNTFQVYYSGELESMNINTYYLNSWGGVVPAPFRDVVVPQPLFARSEMTMPVHQSQIHLHFPTRMMASSSPQIHAHSPANMGYHQHHMFAQGPTTGVSRAGSSYYDMSGSRGASGAHFHSHR